MPAIRLFAVAIIVVLIAGAGLGLGAALGVDYARLWRPGQSTAMPLTWPAIVTDSGVNLRTGSSLQSDVIGSMATGQPVTVTGSERDGFLPVEIEDQRGWIAADYLQRVTAAGQSQVAEQPAGPPDPPSGDMVVGAVEEVAEPTSLPPPEPTPVPTVAVAMVDDGREPGTSDVAADAPAIALDVTDAPGVSAPDIPAGVGSVDTGERWIDVDRTTATVTLYIGNRPQASFPARIGQDPSVDGFYSTAVGTFHVYSMDSSLSSTPFVEDVYLSEWVGFDPVRKNGFHSPVREADGSERVSQNLTTMGCVRLTAEDAVTLYAFAEIGMRVEIHD
ncbi:MAG TPA: SH3 domain-containing protein [Thermomicrobiales bacterium]|nr:SH3 domain-containing protein [Thermomicrobiales bacterium]